MPDVSSLYRAAATIGRVVPHSQKRRPGVIILIYHSISDAEDVITVPPGLFREQIAWLSDHYRIVSLDDALSMDVTEDAVALSFDDGYRDYRTAALPVLRQAAAPSCVYVVTGLLTGELEGLDFRSGLGKAIMTEAEVREIAEVPLVTVGSHTHTHARLCRLTEHELQSELIPSVETLEKLTGGHRFHFCYPWGVFDAASDKVVRRHFVSAATGLGGKNCGTIDPYRLRRIPVRREPLELFQARVRGELFLEDLARRFKDRIRHPK